MKKLISKEYSDKLISKLYIQKKILEEQGYKVAYICIYGSQNYGLDIYTDEYKSDIDMKAIIVPTLDDLVDNCKPISVVVDTEWGQCDIKDIRVYTETLLKANPAYVETLYTDYFVIDSDFTFEMLYIISLRDKLIECLKAQFIRAMYGMMCEKEKALCHPYPSIIDKIEKYGFDGKQLSHTIRLWLMMQKYYINKSSLSDCFINTKGENHLLLTTKLNLISLDNAKILMCETMGKAKEFKDNYLASIDENTIDYSVKNEVFNMSKEIIKIKIINDIEKR